MGAKRKHSRDRAVGNLIKWIHSQSDWDAVLDAILDEHTAFACEALDMDREALFEDMGPEFAMNVFGCALEDLVSRRYEDSPDTVVDEFLKRRGWRETPPGKRYLEALRDSAISLYEVVEVKRGQHVDVRDLIRNGDTIRVSERAGSRQLVQWDHLAARVLPHLGEHIFSGVLLPLSSERADDLRQLIVGALDEACAKLGIDRGEANADTAVLRDLAPIITTAWLSNVVQRLTQPLPELVNFDGEPLQFSETHFEIKSGSIDELTQRLDAVPGLTRDSDDEPAWTWLSDDKGRTKRVVTDEVAFGSLANGEQPTLGSVRIENGQVVLSTNSLERAEQGKALLTERLGDRVGIGMTSVTSVEQMMTEHANEPRVEEQEDDIPLEVKARLLRDFYDQHYRQWLDDSIPALDGQSPREAAANDEGRARLVSLLKQMENREARRSTDSGQLPYDCAWIWAELGVAHLRK